MKTNKINIFYGWYIVMACILLNSVGMGVIGMSGIFFSDIMETMEINQTQVSMIVMFITIGTLAGGAVAGKIIDQLGERKTILFFGIAASLFTGGLGIVSEINYMYGVAILSGIAIFITSVVTVPALITSWFVEKRGLAIGLVMAGTGLSPTLIAPYLAPVISVQGYQVGYIHLAVIMLVTTLFAVLVIKNKPQTIGLNAYGDRAESHTSIKETENTTTKYSAADIDFKSAIKSPSFICFVGFGMSTVFLAAGIVIQVPSYLAFEGISAQMIGFVLAGFGICLVLSKVAAGLMFDKFGIYWGNVIFFIITMLALFSLLLVPDRFGLILYMLVGGAGFTFGSVSNPIMVSTMYGGKDYSKILSIYMLFYSLGAVFASLISGMIIDAFGFNILIFAGGLSCIIGLASSCACLSLAAKQQRVPVN